MKKTVLLLLVIISAILALSACGGSKCDHASATCYEAKSPTCTEDGNVKYYHCPDCGAYSENADLTNACGEPRPFILAKTGHTSISSHQRKAPTCTEAGNVYYYSCDICGDCFSDSAATVAVPEDSVILPPTNHEGTLVFYSGSASSCTADGYIDLWGCYACGKYFTDAAAENELVNNADGVIPATAHGGTLTHVERVEKTCDTNGNLEYWYCSACGYYFDNAECYGGTTDADSFLLVAGHTYSDEWSWDESVHYHAATCSHTSERADEAPHTLNSSHVCTGCGYVFSGLGFYETYVYSQSGYTVYGVNKPTGDIIIPETYNGLPVLKIEDYAFSNCEGITSVSIPSTVVAIGNSAFWGCTALGEIRLPAGLRGLSASAFFGCSSLTEITVPATVEALSSGIFAGCSALERISIPAGKESTNSYSTGDTVYDIFGTEEFEGAVLCNGYYIPGNLTEINIIGGEKLPSTFFKNFTLLGNGITVTLPANMNAIGAGAFSGCVGLTSLDILPIGVTSIGKNAFSGCKGLTAISLPTGVTAVAEGAFDGCSGVLTVTLCRELETVGKYAFRGMSEVSEIVFPDTVLSIEEGALSGWSSLAKLTLPAFELKNGSNPSLGYIFGVDAYDGAIPIEQYNYRHGDTSIGAKYNYYIPTSLTDVTVSSGNIIPYYFYKCTMLTGVSIPADSTSIGVAAFSGCSGLTELPEIPTGVTVIQGSVFYGCGFTELVIPEHITQINDAAFNDCKSLKSVTIGTNVTKFNLTMTTRGFFKGCDLLEEMTLPFVGTSMQEANNSSGAYYAYPNRLITLFGNSASDVPSTLKTVTVLGGEIHPYAFYECSGITKVNLPETTEGIGAYAFGGCSSLSVIELPSSVKKIGNYAFENCSSLEKLYLSSSLSSIGISAFSGCDSFTEAHIDSLEIWLGVSGANYLFGGTNADLYVGGEKLTELVIPEGVDKIRDRAFYGAKSIISVSIPEGVTVGVYAFADCINLSEVNLSKGVNVGSYAFSGCTKIEKLEVPEGAVLSNYALAGCSGIREMVLQTAGSISAGEGGNETHYPFATIFGDGEGMVAITQYAYTVAANAALYSTITCKLPPNLEKITVLSGEITAGAFENCTMIKTVTLGSAVTEINKYAFKNCSSLEYISFPKIEAGAELKMNDAFDGCTSLVKVNSPELASWLRVSGAKNLFSKTSAKLYIANEPLPTSITVPNVVSKINDGAFMGQSTLESLTVLSGVLEIGEYAFADCTALKELNIREGVTEIGKYAFKNCKKLVAVQFPNSAATIGEGALSGCSSINEITLNLKGQLCYIFGTVSYEGSIAVTRKLSSGYTTICYVPESLVGVKVTGGSLDYAAFYNMKKLDYVIISDGVAFSDSDYAFYGCSTLGQVRLPESVTELGEYMFYGCTNLKGLTIPYAVKTIEAECFKECPSFKTAIFENQTVRWSGSYGSYIPSDDTEKNAQWLLDNKYLTISVIV